MQIKTIPTHEKDPQEEKAPRKLLETTSVKMARFIDEHDMENRNEKGEAHFRSVKKNRSNRISRDYKKNTAVEITVLQLLQRKSAFLWVTTIEVGERSY